MTKASLTKSSVDDFVEIMDMLNAHSELARGCIAVSLMLSGSIPLFDQPAFAQAIPDGTTATEINSSGNITNILGGTPAGSSRFHSFSQFDIPIGHKFTFEAPNVTTIFSRVTGSIPSNIDGYLIVDSNADLFLLNPHGILFGPESVLNVGGSFVATTASSIVFSDNTEFSAVNPNSILPVSINANVPVGLRFGDVAPAVIINEGDNLRVGQNAVSEFRDGNIALIGGSVVTTGTILAGEDEQDIFVNEASLVSTGSLNDTSEVQITLNGEFVRFSPQISPNESTPIILPGELIQPIASSLDLVVNSQNHLIVGDPELLVSAGDVIIYRDPDTLSRFEPGERIRAFEVSSDTLNIIANHDTLIYADGFRTSEDSDFNPGDIPADTLNILTANNITIQDTEIRIEGVVDNSPSIFRSGNNIVFENVQLFGSTGDSIALESDSGNIQLDDSPIRVFTPDGQSAVDLSLITAGEISLINSPLLSLIDNETNPVDNPVGNLGDITIRAGSLFIENDSRRRDLTDAMLAINLGEGDGGKINIETIGDIFIAGGITTNAFQSSEPGTISIESETGDIYLSRALLYTRLQDRDSSEILVDPARNNIFTIPEESSSGTPGDIVIIARNGNINFTETSEIRTDTFGSGNAGNILIQTDDGKINVNNSELSANTFGTGNGGQINISATEQVSIENNAAIRSRSTAETPGSILGDGGEIFIQSNQVSIDLSELSATTSQEGAGGSINITGRENIFVSNGSTLEAGTSGTGTGGSINVNVPENLAEGNSLVTPGVSPTGQNVTFSNDAVINAGTSGPGAGGSVQLGASDRLLVQDSEVTVASTGRTDNPGDAGTLISNSSYVQLDNGDLTATSEASNGGNIDMTVDQILLLRNDSEVSAVSSGPESQDGNINISAGGIVGIPQEDSDIIARSSQRGNVEIEAGAIVGVAINQGTEVTPSSEILSTGETVLNLGVDPSQGTQELDQEPEDVALAEGCDASGGEGVAEYYEIGTGGQAAGPDDSLGSGTLEEDWVQLEPQVAWDQLGEVRVSYPENNEQQAEQVAQHPRSCR